MTDAKAPERLMGFALADDDDARYDLFNVRVLSDEESRASREAVDLLSFLTSKSPLVSLERANEKWVAALEGLEAQTDLAAKPAAGEDVQDAFDMWLSAFRRVDYFTREWISGRHDSDSLTELYTDFTRDEFDANAAYRAGVALRNVAQHAGRSINAMSWGTTAELAGGVAHYVDVFIDLQKLLTKSGRYLSAARRQEFESVAAPISAELLVGFATESCVRMFYRLVDAVGYEVESACGLVAQFHREAVAVGGASAVFVANADQFAQQESGMVLRNNGHDELISIHDQVPAIERAIFSPVHVSWDDLIENRHGG